MAANLQSAITVSYAERYSRAQLSLDRMATNATMFRVLQIIFYGQHHYSFPLRAHGTSFSYVNNNNRVPVAVLGSGRLVGACIIALPMP